MSNLISQNTSMAGIIEPQGIKAFSSFSLRHYMLSDQNRYGYGKPRNHNGFWVFSCHDLRLKQKDTYSAEEAAKRN